MASASGEDHCDPEDPLIDYQSSINKEWRDETLDRTEEAVWDVCATTGPGGDCLMPGDPVCPQPGLPDQCAVYAAGYFLVYALITTFNTYDYACSTVNADCPI